MITRKLNELYPNYIISGGIFTDLQTLPVPWEELQIQKSLDIAYHGNNGQRLISPLLNDLEKNTPISQTHRQDVVNILWSLYEKKWTKLYETLLFDYNPIENYRMVEEENGTESGNTSNTIHDTTTNSGTSSNTQTLNTKDKETIDTSDSDTLTHNTTRKDTGTITDDGDGSRSDTVHGFNSTTGVSSDSSTTTSDNTRTNDLTETMTGTDTHVIDHDGTDTYEHTGTVTDSGTSGLSSETNGTNAGTHSDQTHRTLTRSGNIGVTTSQQMIESERVLWDFNYFATVFNDINDVLTLMIY